MAQLTIYLPAPDSQALEQLALLEFRAPNVQAAVIIGAALERQGLLEQLAERPEKVAQS